MKGNWQKWVYRFGLYGIGLIFGSYLSMYYAEFRSETVRLKNGDEAPNIKGVNLEGDSTSLNDYRGKLVLLEFWSSTSGPSHANGIQLAALNNEFKDIYFKDSLRFEIVSVAIDNDEVSWKEVVASNKRNWNHISELTGWESNAVNDYGLTEVPGCYLLNEKGVIIAKTMNYEAIQFALNELK